MRRVRELPILQRVLVANAAIILLGAVVGTWVTARLDERWPLWFLALGFSLSGLAIMGVANYFILRSTFRPLLRLSRALESVHKGERSMPSADDSLDPNLRSVSQAVVDVLDRMEDESRRYSSKMFAAIEDERRRIGRELHDDTSQTLAAALISLDLAEKSLETGGETARHRVENSKELIQYCLDQIKLLVYDLRPSMLDDLGLVPALRWYIHSHVPTGEIEAEVDFDGAGRRLPDDVETALYRIAQEALANVVRHSMATRVVVTLETKPGYAALGIIDNGVGFVPDEVMFDAEGRFGIGLLSIRERAELLDGTVTLDAAPGRGTRVHVVVPLDEETGEVEAQ